MSVLCVGQVVADIVVRPVDGLPTPGRASPVEEMHLLSGGCAANTAAVLAKLGVPVRLAALMGRDHLGDAALADLSAASVGLEAVRREADLPTSSAIVLIDRQGERSFFYRNGGNERLANHHIADQDLKGARIVHLGGALKLVCLDLAQLLIRAKSFGCLISLDTDWDIHGRWMRALHDALPHIDYLMTNQEESAMLTGRQDPRAAAADLLARGPKAVIVKQGGLGAMLATPASITPFPAFRVEVRDTTCAGDAFAAGFLFGLHEDLPLEKSLRLANACGALCTTQISHRGITSIHDVWHLFERTEL